MSRLNSTRHNNFSQLFAMYTLNAVTVNKISFYQTVFDRFYNQLGIEWTVFSPVRVSVKYVSFRLRATCCFSYGEFILQGITRTPLLRHLRTTSLERNYKFCHSSKIKILYCIPLKVWIIEFQCEIISKIFFSLKLLNSILI